MTPLTLLTPVSITATGGGLDLDVSRLSGEASVTLAALNTAGTSPTLACKLQSSTGLTRGHEYQTEGTLQWNELRTASTNNEISGSWTQSGARSIKRIALYLKKAGTLAAGKKLTLKIETNTAGSPSGTLVQNGTSNTVDIDTEVSAGWVVFTFAKPVDVSDATVYHFVLSGDYTAHDDNNVLCASNTVASGGNLNLSDDGTTYAGAVATQTVLAYADQYAFSDITGGTFTTLSTAGNTTVQTLNFHARSLPKIMRLYGTVGGTSNPAFATTAIVSALRVHTS
jgi:hypothetical protein